jgi:polynucleotide 5'-kinase involved in rRNA processing
LCLYQGEDAGHCSAAPLRHRDILIAHEGFLLCVGVVRQIRSDGIELVSPCNSTEQVAAVRLGKLRIEPLTGGSCPRSRSS